MKKAILIAAMLLAAGCGGGDIPAPLACPVAKTDTVSVDVHFTVKSAGPKPDREVLLVVDIDGDIPHLFHDRMRDILGETKTILSRPEVPFGAVLDVQAEHGAYTDPFNERPQPMDSKDIVLDRNCDLLIEIRQKGDDPLTMDVRWIEPVK